MDGSERRPGGTAAAVRSGERAREGRSLGARGAAVTAFALIVLTACSTDSSQEFDGPYGARFTEALSRATSDFEREVLADGNVTRAEYEEAVHRFTGCMEDSGNHVTLIDQGGYYVYEYRQGAGAEEAFERCAEGTTRLIESLYHSLVANPENQDWDEVTLACLKREELAPQGMTLEEYRDAIGVKGISFGGVEGEQSAAGSMTLPFSTDDPRFVACQMNPALGTGSR